MNPAIRLENLTVCYNRHPAIHHLSGSFGGGSLTAIVGPNGAGKSTLLKTLMGLLPVTTGRIEHGLLTRRDIAYLPQQAQMDRNFPISVLDVVMLGHWQRIGILGAVTAELKTRTLAALTAVELAEFQRRPIRTLSAGQFQRVLFARLLLQDARLILLDEPFTAIDARTTADLLGLVRAWHQEQRTVIAVLHDLEQVRAHFPDTLLLARSGIAWGQTDQVLSPDNLGRARQMAQAWDEQAAMCEATP